MVRLAGPRSAADGRAEVDRQPRAPSRRQAAGVAGVRRDRARAAIAAPSAIAICDRRSARCSARRRRRAAPRASPVAPTPSCSSRAALVAFLAGHVDVRRSAFAAQLSPLRWLRIAGWTVLAPAYVSVQMVRSVREHVTGALRALVPVYAGVITVMVVGAFAVATYGGYAGGIKLWIGALAVLRVRRVRRARPRRGRRVEPRVGAAAVLRRAAPDRVVAGRLDGSLLAATATARLVACRGRACAPPSYSPSSGDP